MLTKETRQKRAADPALRRAQERGTKGRGTPIGSLSGRNW